MKHTNFYKTGLHVCIVELNYGTINWLLLNYNSCVLVLFCFYQ